VELEEKEDEGKEAKVRGREGGGKVQVLKGSGKGRSWTEGGGPFLETLETELNQK
jgi:hypothetical protein